MCSHPGGWPFCKKQWIFFQLDAIAIASFAWQLGLRPLPARACAESGASMVNDAMVSGPNLVL